MVLLPVEPPTDRADPLAWLAFAGHWGERNRGPNDGPTGPVTKDSWIDPVGWMEHTWRDASTVVPASGLLGSRGTDFFCGVVTSGSGVYLAVLDAPYVVLGIVVAIAMCTLWVGRRTTWSPVVVLPVDTTRSCGQIVRSAARLYVRRLPLMLGIGVLLFPVGAAVAAVQQVVFRFTPLGVLVSTASSDRLFGAVVALSLGSVAAVFAIAVMQGTVAAGMVGVARGERTGAIDAYRIVLPRVPAILWATARTMTLMSVLALTVAGIPVALYVAVRRAIVPQLIVHEGLGAGDAIRRSRVLTSGNEVRVGMLAMVANVVVSVAAPLLAMVILLLLSPPLGVVILIAGVLGAIAVPYAGIVLTLVFHDLQRRSAPESPGTPVRNNA